MGGSHYRIRVKKPKVEVDIQIKRVPFSFGWRISLKCVGMHLVSVDGYKTDKLAKQALSGLLTTWGYEGYTEEED